MPAAEYSSLAYVNYALGLLGENPITSFDPADGSTSGLAGTVYDRLVETMLCGWPWNFVQQRLTLTADGERYYETDLHFIFRSRCMPDLRVPRRDF